MSNSVQNHARKPENTGIFDRDTEQLANRILEKRRSGSRNHTADHILVHYTGSGGAEKQGIFALGCTLSDTMSAVNGYITYMRQTDPALVQKVQNADPKDVRLCSVVLAELYYGAFHVWRLI